MSRLLTAAALALATTLTAAGCGSGNSQPQAAPLTPTTDTTPTQPNIDFPTPTPSYPLSEFEDDPAVQTLRRHYAALSRGHNADDYRRPELTETMTPDFVPESESRVRANHPGTIAPGPYPFTPTHILDDDAGRYVFFCAPTSGWWIDAETGERAGEWEIGGKSALLVHMDDRWVVKDVYTAEEVLDCSEYEVQELPW